MDRREKTEFILEQMRLLIALARLKDSEIGHEGKDAIGGGESEWVKVRVGGRKVNEEFLKNKENEVFIRHMSMPEFILTYECALRTSSSSITI